MGWGSNWNHSKYVPVTLPNGLSNVVAIAVGFYHSLALTAQGRVVGWISNIGDDTDTWGLGIVPSGLSNVVAIAAGGGHSLALTAEGQVGGVGQ